MSFKMRPLTWFVFYGIAFLPKLDIKTFPYKYYLVKNPL